MDSRLRGNDGERFARTHDYVVSDLSLSFPRRRESIGHYSDPHWGSFLESTESSMLGSIFSGASTIGRSNRFAILNTFRCAVNSLSEIIFLQQF